jgi:hypothetical protein
MHSNSSRFRCRLRNAAARFFTSRASRLLRPVTSGGMKSLLLMRSPDERGFLVVVVLLLLLATGRAATPVRLRAWGGVGVGVVVWVGERGGEGDDDEVSEWE